MTRSSQERSILAVDTTGDFLSLALEAGGRVFPARRKAGLGQDELLLPAVDALLERAGLAMKDLDAIAVASGPGRFTGIRIGMAYAAVAASRLGVPALAVSRLEALAYGAPGRLVCAVAPGWRGERYGQFFARATDKPGPARPAGEPAWLSPEGWAAFQRDLRRRGAVLAEGDPGAPDLLGPARDRLIRGRAGPFEPLYLKPAGYELPSRPVR